GRYNIHNFQLHYEKIALKTFPFGDLRIIVVTHDNKKSKNLSCILAEVENRNN
ncbi:hypothetical protein ILUMI_18282, partial [Ignelater luminosus]